MPSQKAPSPLSAVLTVSLDGYLDDKRMSYGSPPDSELTIESFPVFSPSPSIRRNGGGGGPTNGSDPSDVCSPSVGPTPPVPATTMLMITLPPQTTPIPTTTTTAAAVSPQPPQQQHTLQPGGVQMRQHRRQSSINTVSWTDQGGDSSSLRPLSYNLDPSDVCRAGLLQCQLWPIFFMFWIYLSKLCATLYPFNCSAPLRFRHRPADRRPTNRRTSLVVAAPHRRRRCRPRRRCGAGRATGDSRAWRRSRGAASIRTIRPVGATATPRGCATANWTTTCRREPAARRSADRSAGDRWASFTIASRCACRRRTARCSRIMSVRFGAGGRPLP